MELRKTFNGIVKRQSAFTLIELVVVIGMLGVLLVGLIATFNPVAQYNKAKDGQRESDLGQIQRALDTYLNDTGCYPTSLTFNQKWSVNGTVYMEKVPQDPDCIVNGTKCYWYETDTTTSCPQWDVLYSALRSSAIPANACPLATRSQCTPNGFTANNYNYCLVSGSVDCQVVSSFVITNQGGGGGGSNPTATPFPTPTPTMPPTPTPGCPNNQYYGCTGDNRCNSIAPKTQCTGFGGSVTCYCDQHCSQSCRYN